MPCYDIYGLLYVKGARCAWLVGGVFFGKAFRTLRMKACCCGEIVEEKKMGGKHVPLHIGNDLPAPMNA